MAKTVYLNNYAGLAFGYEVNTPVVSAGFLMSPGDPNAEPPIPPEIIGVKVYPASIANIEVNQLLNISGAGDITVSGVDSDAGGDFFTYSVILVPAPGASVRTPWNPSGALLVARDNNSVTLTYYLPAEHDLYFGTQKTADSGSISATLDGAPLGTFNLSNATTILASVLLQSNVEPGVHTVVIQALVATPAVFVYFHKFELLEHIPETGGEYIYLGPVGTVEDSLNNFVGDWSTTGTPFPPTGYAWTITQDASVFFYPQLGEGGQVKVRLQKTPDSGIVAVYANGQFRQNLDLYASPAQPLFEATLLDHGAGDAAGLYEMELRHTGTKNGSSSGFFFYFRSAVVVYARTDAQALALAANYLKQVAAIRGDGAFLDAWDSNIINFDSNALYGSMGLLATYEYGVQNPGSGLALPAYLDAVKNFLTWFAAMQVSDPGNSFNDGAWNIGYEINPAPPPTYRAALGPYAAQGISEIKWVDAVQCLPAFLLWWYWTLSNDTATKNALLPKVQKAMEGFLDNNYDPETGFYFSSWQNKTGPTIFLYHDAIRRYAAGGGLLELHNDAEEGFFTYSGAWSSYAPQGAIHSDEHFTLASQSYVQFSLALASGDQVKWVTQTAWDVGIAEILVSTDGNNFSAAGTVDGYSQALVLQQEFPIYTAPAGGTYWFRIRHSGTINAAGNIAPGWQRLESRFTAGQTDVAMGLTALWLLTREARYATLAARLIRRFPGQFWGTADGRWLISRDGPAPGSGNNFWFPMNHGYAAFGQMQSRFFQPVSRFAQGLQALEPYQDAEGGFLPPGYVEPEHIFSAFYCLGENQLAAPTSAAQVALAKEFLKSGQYLLQLGGQQVGGIPFSKRYQYLYTNIAGFACLALAGTENPIVEQLRFSESRLVQPQ